MSSPTGNCSSPNHDWTNARYLSNLSGPGTHVVSAGIADVMFETEFEVIGNVDVIELVAGGPERIEVVQGESRDVCFRAITEVGSEARTVLGPGWVFSTESDLIDVTSPDSGFLARQNCAGLRGVQVGDATLRIEVKGAARDLTVSVVATSAP